MNGPVFQRPAVASEAKWYCLSDDAVRTLRMGLVSWQRDLQRAPGLLATQDGARQWDVIGSLLDTLK